MSRFLCVHLHFYQPPRENPWLDEIEFQESAYPFHDWNERISMESYRANGASRVLDSEGRVINISNNYTKTSFNFGPTLLSWLEDKDPQTYSKILEGDRLSQKKFGGHGSAIAQCYNHVIMPLANRRDKETQVLWGLRDFERRFKRTPESMWLPETAVDLETLNILSDHGMKYVILAPRQARRIRALGDSEWTDVSGEKVNPLEPYLIQLDSGRSISAFFYDGPISKAVAFEGLLHNGESFANRLLSGFSENANQRNQLLHVATDGETYGHHHALGDMALAYALTYIEKNGLAQLTNYGQYLELNPPQKEAQIFEYSSWSCEHGVERWRSNCGCGGGGRRQGDWHQKWRQPLRKAVDLVRERLEAPFEVQVKTFIPDPWAARNDYIRVIEDRSLANIDSFLKKWCQGKTLTDAETTFLLKAFESQRHLMLMYTSCAWFFSEVSGIETVQNLQYAYRALELAEASLGVDLLDDFLKELDAAESNIEEYQNGRAVFEKLVRPARVDNVRIGIHFAIASIFESFGEMNEVFNNKITLLEFSRFNSGKATMVCGHARIRSRITLERQQIIFNVLHLGDHNVSAGVKTFQTDDEYDELLKAAEEAFSRADFPQSLRVIDRYFGGSTYSLKDLFKDEQRRILDLIMKEAMQATEERFRRLYESNYPLLCYLADANLPVPKVFSDIAEFVENRSIRKALVTEGRVKIKKLRRYLADAKDWGTRIDMAGLERDLESVLLKKMKSFEADDENFEKLEEILDLVRLKAEWPHPLYMGLAQNWFYSWYKKRAKKLVLERAASGLELSEAEQKIEKLAQMLADELKVKLAERQEEKNDISIDLPLTT